MRAAAEPVGEVARVAEWAAAAIALGWRAQRQRAEPWAAAEAVGEGARAGWRPGRRRRWRNWGHHFVAAERVKECSCLCRFESTDVLINV